MPQAGRGDWGRGGVPRTPTPPGPPYLSASRPLKYAWTYSVKAVATGSASWEPSTTGLGPRDSPGETNRLRAWMGPPPHDPLSSPPRTHRAPAGTRRRSPARPGWRAPSARGHSSRRARGSASVTAKQDGIGGGGSWVWPPPWGSRSPAQLPPHRLCSHAPGRCCCLQPGRPPASSCGNGEGGPRAGPLGGSHWAGQGEHLRGAGGHKCRVRRDPPWQGSPRGAPTGSHQCHEFGRSQPCSQLSRGWVRPCTQLEGGRVKGKGG